MPDQPKIYLAGPGVFEKDPTAHADGLKDLCQSHGMVGVFPLDSAFDLCGLSKGEAARAIYQANIELIETCDGLLADMRPFRGPGMDGGTAFEMGYGRALGKPIFGYGAVGLYFERCQAQWGELSKGPHGLYDPDDLLVEDFDQVDNLMMSCGADQIFEQAEEAIKAFRRWFGSD